MILFASEFPELGRAETRVIMIPEDANGLPAGRYALAEHYCEDLKCDCRRVIISVIEESKPAVSCASINFGWESEAFYKQWMHGDAEAAREITGASLDPLNYQAPYADALLDLFQNVVIQDKEYVKRLERHYWMFKRNVRLKATPSFSKKRQLKG